MIVYLPIHLHTCIWQQREYVLPTKQLISHSQLIFMKVTLLCVIVGGGISSGVEVDIFLDSHEVERW